MIILTNCLTETADEGALKVANSLVRRIREQSPDVKVISYERQTRCSDIHLSLNKLMLNPKLLAYLWHSKEDVLYIPFPARMLPISWRVFVLSLFVRRRLKVVSIMQRRISRPAGLLLRMSKAEIFSLSKESWEACQSVVGERAKRLKAGVDTKRFVPAAAEKRAELRRKYNIPQERTVVLHVGHMNEGRNIQQFLKLDEKYFGLIVISTFTGKEQDLALRRRLEACENIRIIDSFLPNIEEIYQLSDVYLFPVANTGSCIDAPLSAFEAASCGIPVVHTAYGALTELCGADGFYRIGSFDSEHLNQRIADAVSERKNPRDGVLGYDWGRAMDCLCK